MQGACRRLRRHLVYIEHTAGYRPLTNVRGNLGGNPPKRDSEVTEPVYAWSSGALPLASIVGPLLKEGPIDRKK